MPRRELPGVAQQVLEHGADQLRVGPADEARRHVHDHIARRVPFAQLGDERCCQRREVDLLEVHLVPVEPGELEESVHQPGHVVGRSLDAAQVASAGVVQRLAVVLQQDLAEPIERAERRAQVVGDRVGERLELAVRRLELRRPLGDAALEVGGQTHDLALRALLLRHVAHVAADARAAVGERDRELARLVDAVALPLRRDHHAVVLERAEIAGAAVLGGGWHELRVGAADELLDAAPEECGVRQVHDDVPQLVVLEEGDVVGRVDEGLVLPTALAQLLLGQLAFGDVLGRERPAVSADWICLEELVRVVLLRVKLTTRQAAGLDRVRHQTKVRLHPLIRAVEATQAQPGDRVPDQPGALLGDGVQVHELEVEGRGGSTLDPEHHQPFDRVLEQMRVLLLGGLDPADEAERQDEEQGGGDHHEPHPFGRLEPERDVAREVEPAKSAV